MKIKRLVMMGALGVSVLLTAAVATQAGPQKGVPGKPANRVAGPLFQPLRIALEQLNLTDAQRGQTRVFFQQAEVALRAIRENARLTPDQKRAAMQKVVTTLRTNILRILTPEQRERLKALLAKRRDVLRDGIETLNLTPAQKRQIQGFFQQARTQAEAIQQNDQLTPEQKREALQRLHRELQARVLRVLTPEQREQLRQWMANHRPGPGKL